MNFWRQALLIAGKDLRSEFRTKESINGALAFALVILLLFSFAFDPTAEQVREISGGLLWLVFGFAGALILNRSFAREATNECVEVLMASPASPGAIFMGKCGASFVLLLALELICLPVFGMFYNVRWAGRFLELLGILALGGWGIAVVGNVFSALTVNLRLRELMLPALVYPLLIPALMAAMQATARVLAGSPLSGEAWGWLKLLIGFDVIFTALALLLVDSILAG